MIDRAGRSEVPLENSGLNLARAAAVAATALGAVMIAAWLLNIEPLVSISDDLPRMSLEAAISLFLCGGSAVASLSEGDRPRRLAGYLALLPLLLSCVQLIELASNNALGVERMLARLFIAPGPDADFSIGMSPNTSVAILAFCLAQAYDAFFIRSADALALTTGGLIASGLGMTAIVGYAVGLDYAYQWRDYEGMALQAAIGIWLLGLTLLIRARHVSLDQSSRLPFAAASVLSLAGLLFDLSTPPFIGSNVIYIPLVLSAIWFADRRIAFSFAFICALFSLLAYVAKVEYHDGLYQHGIGRSFGIATLFIVASLIYYFKVAVQQSEAGKFAVAALMNNAPDAVVTIDDHGRIKAFNPAAERLFGYRQQDVLGRNVNILMPEPYHSAHDGYLQRYAETGEQRIIGTIREVSGRRSDGSLFPLDLSISVLSAGRERQFVGVLRDLTGRKKQEETLRQALNRLGAYAADLERSNQELDEFAYIASHDLKEPLRGLHNHSRFLLEDYEQVLGDDGKRRLNRLLFLSQRMEKLVNDLLYFSRIGRQELAVRKTDVNGVIRDIQGTIEQFLEERHAKVEVRGTLPAITCDAVRITEVFRNLIVNGVKYNDKPEKRIEIGFLDIEADEAGREVRNVFYVRDNGKGIAPEFYQDIFRIFKRLEKSETEGEGTGVGLTFVRKIIARHGGKIWLRSEPGVGTTFFFTLAMEQE